MRKKTPAKERAEFSAARTKGKLAGSALAEMLTRFTTLQSAGRFIEWRRNPMTIMFIDAVRELAINPPPAYVSPGDLGVEYGLTSGLSLAASLMDDPSSVYPHLFSAASPGADTEESQTAYSVEPDAALGSDK